MALNKKAVIVFVSLILLTVLVNSSPPTITEVIVNSTFETNLTSENLTAYWTFETDNATKNITNWRLNGSSVAVLNMPFEKNLTGTNTKDYSGFGNDGAVTGATWNATGGFDGKGAYEFDGTTSDYITVADDTTLNTTEGSFMAWMKAEPVQGAAARVVSIGTVADRTEIYISASGATSFSMTKSSSVVVTLNSPSTLNDTQWHHVAGTWDSSEANFYVDGVVTASSPDVGENTLTSTSYPFAVGRYVAAAVGYTMFKGTIDEVKLFNRSLSAEQVKAIYDNQSEIIVSQETSKADNWSCCVTPNDGIQDGSEVCSVELSVQIAPVISNLVLNSTSGANDVSDNLTAYWDVNDENGDDVKSITNWVLNGTSISVLNMPFEKVDDSTINATKDYSGFDNNGSEVDGVLWNATGGYDGNGAYVFDGVDDRIDLPQVLDSDSFSISAWINENTSGGGSGHGIFYQGTCISDGGTTIGEYNGGFFFYVGGGGILGGSSIPLNEWVHVVAVSDNLDLKIYKNGVDTGLSGTGSGSPTANPSKIGVWATCTDGNRYFDGTIDDVQIFNRSLSAEQVLNIYNNRTDLLNANETYNLDNWSICVTPNDGTQDGNEECTEGLIVVLANIKPEVTTPVITPSTPTFLQNLTTSTTYTDINADTGTVYFAWYVNDVNVWNQTNSSIEVGTTVFSTLDNNNYSIGNLVNVSVYANDSELNSDTKSSSTVEIIGLPGECVFDLWRNYTGGDIVFSIDCEGNAISVGTIEAPNLYDTSEIELMNTTLTTEDTALGVRITDVNDTFLDQNETNYQEFVNISGDTMTGNLTAPNVFLPQYIFSHTNATIPVLGASQWTNITFSQEDSDIKQGITHTFNDATNHTFTIMQDGIYNVDYDLDVEDTSPSASDIDVAGRLILTNGSEVIGSVFETDITKQGAEIELSHNFLVSCKAGEQFVFQVIADDADVQISTHGAFGDYPESATILMNKIANLE